MNFQSKSKNKNKLVKKIYRRVKTNMINLSLVN